MKRLHKLRALLPPLILAISAGCAVQPPEDVTQAPTGPAGRELTEVEQLLIKAKSSPAPMAAEYTLLAARKLLEQQRSNQARELLNALDPTTLTLEQHAQLAILQSDIELTRNQPEQALIYLHSLPTTSGLASSTRLQYERQQIRALQAQGASPELVRKLIEITPLLPAEEATGQPQAIWDTLRRLEYGTLKRQVEQPGNSYDAQGWFELATLARKPDQDLEQQSRGLREWLTLWDLHPAARDLPTELQALRLGTGARQRIALLLPLSGPLERPAKAIREGIMSAYYASLDQRDSDSLQIQLYDSTAYNDLRSFLAEIQTQEIDIIVGPLDKDKVAELNRLAPSTPTLALNYLPDASETSNLFQLGLSAEDEARQVAARAWQDGHRVAITLTPDTAWGRRIEQEFAAQWQSLGGTLAEQERFGEEGSFSDRISLLLNVDESAARADRLNQLLPQRLNSEARRRQDADVLLLSALPTEARQIKPTLAFHYAGQLPVYATSHVFSGTSDERRDIDLNGILFGETPWLLNPAGPLKAQLAAQRNDVSTRFGRLYALGIDAFQLTSYLNRLDALPGSYIDGETGRLQLESNRRISRGLSWARFQDGLANPL